MSVIETAIWYILGYAAMPVIFLAGFVGVAAVSVWLLQLFGARPIPADRER